ncbi:putative DNA repair protein Rad1 [Pyronema domesticum]|uniref:Similar to DNA damage checkpoint control protein rad1 acc. no. P22193 n=1 Tax=Pyronema omphalodes (strain CBS 100304) TaxID=1076935 RepID=U4LH09_PYROM|nr:putative DNA repair protein Rad1 [Pyronema domesticum]CCX11133.1 Similar to DNA damage checkpoint control protein rad1; acc. no. P22193 [Pyronema omphalodes CBS 100304]
MPSNATRERNATENISTVIQDEPEPQPVFTATSSNARQLYNVLKCLNFQSKAQIEINHDGLIVTVEDSRVMQGTAFIESALFTSFVYNPRPTSEASDPPTETFALSLSILLECLQIFTPAEPRQFSNGGQTSNNVFSPAILRSGGTAKFTYNGPGSPLFLTLAEGGDVTTCELTTYEPEMILPIPLRMEELGVKVIMKAAWLHDAIRELDNNLTDTVTLLLRPSSVPSHPSHPSHPPSAPSAPAPDFLLLTSGPLGSATVEFGKQIQILHYTEGYRFSYAFHLIKNAGRAMGLATKASVRGDSQGVLSLQFMIEGDGGGDRDRDRGGVRGTMGEEQGNMGKKMETSFLDFRFVAVEEEE